MNKYVLKHSTASSDEVFNCATAAAKAAYFLSRDNGNTPVKVVSVGSDMYTELSYNVTVNIITAPEFDEDNMPTYEHLNG